VWTGDGSQARPGHLPRVRSSPPSRLQTVHYATIHQSDLMDLETDSSAGPRIVRLGATRPEGEDVYADPAGHPFCLIRRPDWAPPIPLDS
jgi:hypothetical protein